MTPPAPLLEIEDLEVEFATEAGRLRVVRGLDLRVPEGRSVGVVGESGCGKSVSMLAVLGLLRANARVSGTIRYRGEPVDTPEAVAALRGSRVAMVFQDAMHSLNPLMKVGVQVAEGVRHHRRCSQEEARSAAVDYLDRVRLPSPDRMYSSFPHELSGGMRQRVMLAGALACEPEVLVADEPTTGLDVTVQAEILDLLIDIQADAGLAVVFISHDLAAVAELCEDLYVVYAGRVVEHGPTAALLSGPRHPYTQALFESVPVLGRRDVLRGIEGMPPGPRTYPPGCAFAPRCGSMIPERCGCAPPTVEVEPGRHVECWLEVEGGRG